MTMDALSIIIATVRQVIEASGAPPDALQDHLAEVERRARGSLGGGTHYISRVPNVSTKTRIIELADQTLTAAQIAERLEVSDRYVRRVLAQLRACDN